MDPAQLRQNNIDVFQTMLGHLGRRDYENCGKYLAEDIYADWPYRPMPSIPDKVLGRDQLIAYFRGEVAGSSNGGLDDFTPLSYEIDAIHELLDANALIAEYQSHATHVPSNKPYNNRYISLLKFSDGKVTYWREYVNPAVIYEIFDMLQLPGSR